MKQLISDIIGFTKNLTQIDLLLYIAVLVLIILVVSLIYIIKTSNEEEVEPSVLYNEEDIDLKEIVNNIENAEAPIAKFTSYETEQEEKAIISYDELLEKRASGAINYDEETLLEDGISVRKINLDKASNNTEPLRKQNSVFNYEKEEAFLKAIQTLNQLLN